MRCRERDPTQVFVYLAWDKALELYSLNQSQVPFPLCEKITFPVDKHFIAVGISTERGCVKVKAFLKCTQHL